MDDLSRRPVAASLFAGLLLVVATFVAAGSHAPRVAVLGPLPPGADFLYLQPAAGIDPPALARGVTHLGYELAGDPRPGDPGLRIRVPHDADPRDIATSLAATGLLRSVEVDSVIRAAQAPVEETVTSGNEAPPPSEVTPADPLYQERQAHYLEVIRAPEAWARQTGDRSVLIAIVDTGVAYDHPDLEERIFINERETFLNGRDDDNSGCIDDIAGCSFVSLATADPSCGYTQAPPHWRAMDDEGHGTFVAGLAAAHGDNGTGMAGVAWDARILPVKVLDCTATGRISDAAAGIRYAARMGADLINISFGTISDSPVLADAIAFARDHGAIIVASAGNDGRRGVTYPALYADVVSVAASGLLRPIESAEQDDGDTVATQIDYLAVAPFANFGGNVDFLAPGVELLSTVPAHLCGRRGWTCIADPDAPDGPPLPYAIASGSSFATPLVTGALALLIAEHSHLSSDFAVNMLLGARQRSPIVSGTTVGGTRVLDVAAALDVPIYRLGIPNTSRTSPSVSQ